uniref:Uncharacterized protein n=1 Tax=Ralstonia solanacearum TaxID=305 RepID=A0A0S4U464_RALSL|nr:protein of unknown function [Ralstonia solanacearum]
MRIPDFQRRRQRWTGLPDLVLQASCVSCAPLLARHQTAANGWRNALAGRWLHSVAVLGGFPTAPKKNGPPKRAIFKSIAIRAARGSPSSHARRQRSCRPVQHGGHSATDPPVSQTTFVELVHKSVEADDLEAVTQDTSKDVGHGNCPRPLSLDGNHTVSDGHRNGFIGHAASFRTSR